MAVCRRELVQLCVQVVGWRRWAPVHATLLPQVQVAARRIHRDVGAVVVAGLGLGRPKDLGVLSARNVEPWGHVAALRVRVATTRPAHTRRTLPVDQMPIVPLPISGPGRRPPAAVGRDPDAS